MSELKTSSFPLHCGDARKVIGPHFSPAIPTLSRRGGAVVTNDWCISLLTHDSLMGKHVLFVMKQFQSLAQDWVMKIHVFLWSFILFHGFRKSICKLVVKEMCAKNSNLLLGDLPKIFFAARISDSLNMTLAVDSGCKTLYLDETKTMASTYKNTAQPGSLLCIEKCSGGIFDQVQKTCFPISYFFTYWCLYINVLGSHYFHFGLPKYCHFGLLKTLQFKWEEQSHVVKKN